MKQKSLISLLFGLLFTALSAAPNIVLINMDDMGYSDLSCMGADKWQTPHLDQLAKEGRLFTDFLMTASICTPSRASLMTGCYPLTVGMSKSVLFPEMGLGLHPKEKTIADYFQENGYATACVGKWHLGHHPETLPTAQGFDSYFGVPYSNDMNYPHSKPRHPKSTKALNSYWTNVAKGKFSQWNTPLYKGTTVIEVPLDQRTITRRYTDKAIEFITTEKQEKPMFLYLAHSMPHVPLYVPQEMYDPDPLKAYGLVMKHIDAEIGRLMHTIRNHPTLSKNTYVIFTSDNGPNIKYRHHGGQATPLSGGKFSVNEGGFRVPFIIWAPGKIPANTRYENFVTAMDLLPTLTKLANISLDKSIPISGFDITAQLTANEPSPYAEFLYYNKDNLVGIRQGSFKLLLKKGKPFLYNLADDISESKNLAKESPKRVENLIQRMKASDKELRKQARPAWIKKTKN